MGATPMNKYLIQLNVGQTIYNISATSENKAYRAILSHEKFYNPEWGYKVLRIDYGPSMTLKKELS
jgi:hypothetical protein